MSTACSTSACQPRSEGRLSGARVRIAINRQCGWSGAKFTRGYEVCMLVPAPLQAPESELSVDSLAARALRCARGRREIPRMPRWRWRVSLPEIRFTGTPTLDPRRIVRGAHRELFTTTHLGRLSLREGPSLLTRSALKFAGRGVYARRGLMRGRGRGRRAVPLPPARPKLTHLRCPHTVATRPPVAPRRLRARVPPQAS